MTSLIYINKKLSDAIYILTVDEGDARTRLAKVYYLINRISTSSCPIELQKDVEFVKSTMERGNRIRIEGTIIHKLTGIKNSTARKVIERILYIEGEIERLTDRNFE